MQDPKYADMSELGIANPQRYGATKNTLGNCWDPKTIVSQLGMLNVCSPGEDGRGVRFTMTGHKPPWISSVELYILFLLASFTTANFIAPSTSVT